MTNASCPDDHQHIPINQENFNIFSQKSLQMKMKTPFKSFHIFCWGHRVYGIQNDQINLRKNEFLTVLKTMHCSRRYLQFFNSFLPSSAQTSSPTSVWSWLSIIFVLSTTHPPPTRTRSDFNQDMLRPQLHLQFKADWALFSFYSPPTHRPPIRTSSD